MKYTKPEIRSFGLASVAIESDVLKDDVVFVERPGLYSTTPAYEADE